MPTDSYAPITATILLETPTGPVVIPPHQFLQSLTLTSSGAGHWSGSMTLFDEEAYEIENLLLAAGAERRFRITFGDDDAQPQRRPAFVMQAVNYTPEFTPEGVTIQIELVGEEVAQALRDKKIRSWPEQTELADIVRDIADDNGWLDKAVIEDTGFKTTEPLHTNNESDIKFIMEQVVPLSVSKDTNQAFYFYFEPDGILHFHSELKVEKLVSQRFKFARDAMGDVLSFSPTDDSFYANIKGGGNAIFDGAAAIDGGKVEVETVAGQGHADAGGAVLTTDEAYVTNHGNGTHARIHFTVRDPEEFRARVQAFHDRVAKTAYNADLSVKGTHRIFPHTYIEVDYILPNGESHYLSGVYLVMSVTHTYDQGGWVTQISMGRRGTRNNISAERVTNAQVQEVQGDAANPATTHSSPVTQE